jgi:NADH:ubiquinone oxidoreductase subunit K
MSSAIPIYYFLILAALMFFTGIFGFLTRKNLISILISAELMFNSVNIYFVVFNRYLYPFKLEGMFFSIFIIAVVAAEAFLALAIIINIYRRLGSVSIDGEEEIKNIS